MKRLISAFTSAVLIFCFCVNGYAYKHEPPYVSVTITDMPYETAFVDVLLPREAFKEDFTDFNDSCRILSSYRYIRDKNEEAVTELTLSSDSEISSYSSDGYYSFLCHFKGAQTDFSSNVFSSYYNYYNGSAEDTDCTAQFDIYLTDDSYKDPFEVFKKAGSIRFAYLDENGRILMITDAVSVKDKPLRAKSLDYVMIAGTDAQAVYYKVPLYSVLRWLIPISVTGAAAVAVSLILNKKARNEES